MTSKVENIDDILIGVFLTASILFVVVWSIAMLKWRKKFLYRIFPCIKKKKSKNDQKQNEIVNTSTKSDGLVNHSFSDANMTKVDNSNQIYTIDLNNNNCVKNNPVQNDFNQVSIENEVKL